MKIQTVRKVKKYVKRILLVLSVLMIIVEGLLLVMDEKVLWNVLPGVTSTNDTQSFCTGWVEAAEAFPLDNLDNATEHQKMGAGLIMMAVTGKILSLQWKEQRQTPYYCNTHRLSLNADF